MQGLKALLLSERGKLLCPSFWCLRTYLLPSTC